jgi:hypothetical protein
MINFLAAVFGAVKNALTLIGSLLLVRAGADRAKRQQAEAERDARKKQAAVAADLAGLDTDDIADRVRQDGF